MWYLTSNTELRILYVASANTEIIIGRSVDGQCNFAITNDASISRKHASLTISGSSLCLQDLGSKYGTFVKRADSEEKVEPDNKVTLQTLDVIRFGKLSCIWTVHEKALVTCTSTLKGDNLQNLKMCLGQLGGILKGEWDDSCAYLTMPAITLTIKVVLALVQGSHIVTVDFWNKCLESVRNGKELPNANNYVPQVIESTLNKEVVSFLPMKERSLLFVGKTFIFFSKKQLDMYKPALVKGSATALLLSESKIIKSNLCADNIIVIQCNLAADTQVQRDQINDIVNYLKSKGKRVIADAEIGLAILYCSIQKYCNPNFSFSSEVMKQSSGNQPKEANVLAPETQESTGADVKKENVVIDESLMSTNDADNSTSKRKFVDNNDFTNANKKMTTNNTWFGASIDASKRKLDDESQGNPTKKVAIDTNESEDAFNFFNTSTGTNANQTEKKLNFSKPLKRRADNTNTDDDELFNFLQDDSKNAGGSVAKKGLFDLPKQQDTNKAASALTTNNNKVMMAERGSKLKELMESNMKINANSAAPYIKKEITDDELDQRFNNLDLGTTVIVVRKDLIVKQEPLDEAENNHAKNFKKFRKVWPVRRQNTIIPSSSMTIVIPDDTVRTEGHVSSG